MGLYDYTVYNIIKRNAGIYGNRVAWISAEERITHRKFRERVDRVACGLLELGLKKGDRIAVLAQNSLEFLYLYGASAKIGIIVVPINWRLKPEELEYIVSDVSPRLVFADKEFQELIAPLASKFPYIEKCYSMGKAEGNFTGFKDLMNNNGKCPEIDVKAEDAFVIIHTAAVGGRPRGAILSHKGIIVTNVQVVQTWNLTENSCYLCMVPLFHMAGLGTCLQVSHAGGTNIVHARFDPDLALKHIKEDKVSVFIAFPPMMKTILERNQELKYDLTSLEVVSGPETPDFAKKVEEITGATFWGVYAQSETTTFVSMAPLLEKGAPGGRACLMAEIEIRDEAGNAVKAGREGEIVVRGPQVFNGYWNMPEETEYTFRDGWHHTGDKGSLDEDGFLFFLGPLPKKELIKPGGENVYPAEVEAVILEHPKVEATAVIGVPDEEWGEAIKAICVVKKDESLDESELIDFVASKIARYKKPKYVVFITELPKNEDGSINRERVKAEYGKV
ncbi:MAG: AMP-binding protein [Desulfobacterales bacterium]|nr:AMP-binding protein [Desulfobacterales bacterium]